MESLQVDKENIQLKGRVTGITQDSRRVQRGSLFVAIRGSSDDGHRYLSEAVSRGALALVVSEDVGADLGVPRIRVADTREALARLSAQFYGEPSKSLRVLGVTGTNGKTTLTFLLESILQAAGRKPAVLGTINYRYGDTIVPAPTTTPESVDLQELMATMRDRGMSDVVMEVSSHALDQGRVRGIHFDVGLFTNLSQDHLDYHGSFEAYLNAKLRLFTEFLPASVKADRFAVLNMEDPASETVAGRCPTEIRILRTGRTGPYEITTRSYELSAEGVRAEVMAPGGPFKIESHLLGTFNLDNILLAVGASVALGLSIEAIVEGIRKIGGIPGRLERIPNQRGLQIFVDYAHSPEALAVVGETVRRMAAQRVITVFGCGGDRDRTKRGLMGRRVAEFSDLIVVTSDNPRSEDPERIIDEILPGIEETGFPRERIFRVVDRREAIAQAIGMARRGDLILIAGKGHEETQIVGSRRIPFSDQGVVRELLAG